MIDPASIAIRVDTFPSDSMLNALWRAAWGPDEPRRFQKSLRTCLLHLTAHHGDRLVGFVKVASDGDIHAFLLDPTVDPEYRRSGLGTRLVTEAARVAAERGAKYLHAGFYSPLEGFYTKCGFAPTPAGLIRL